MQTTSDLGFSEIEKLMNPGNVEVNDENRYTNRHSTDDQGKEEDSSSCAPTESISYDRDIVDIDKLKALAEKEDLLEDKRVKDLIESVENFQLGSVIKRSFEQCGECNQQCCNANCDLFEEKQLAYNKDIIDRSPCNSCPLYQISCSGLESQGEEYSSCKIDISKDEIKKYCEKMNLSERNAVIAQYQNHFKTKTKRKEKTLLEEISIDKAKLSIDSQLSLTDDIFESDVKLPSSVKAEIDKEIAKEVQEIQNRTSTEFKSKRIENNEFKEWFNNHLIHFKSAELQEGLPSVSVIDEYITRTDEPELFINIIHNSGFIKSEGLVYGLSNRFNCTQELKKHIAENTGYSNNLEDTWFQSGKLINIFVDKDSDNVEKFRYRLHQIAKKLDEKDIIVALPNLTDNQENVVGAINLIYDEVEFKIYNPWG